MKIVKNILIGFGLIVVILLIAALFVKKEYTVEREITINKPKDEVFAYIKLLKNQDKYSVWYAKDPNIKKEYTGIDGTEGFIASWQSENKEVGSGEQEIKRVTEGERMNTELRFKEPFESTSQAYMTTEAVSPTQTKVKWGFNGAFPYPMNLMMLTMDMDKEVGKDFATGLSNLKNILEKQ